MNPSPLSALLFLALPVLAAPARAADAPPRADASDQQASTDELVQRGRDLLANGDADGALPWLERADAQSGSALSTRVWLVRCWIARGYVNDALDAVDDLSGRGEEGAATDYLYGLALHARAKQYIAEKVGGGMIEMNLRDAAAFLGRATAADPAQYADAFLPLAEAAWQGQDLPVARAAIEQAVTLRPDGFDEAYLLGRIAFSQYVAATGDEARGDEADAEWQRAFDAFVRAIELAGEPQDPARRSLLAQVHLQAAFALVWKERKDEASEHFSQAIAWDPAAVDYRGLRNYLEPLGVLRCLERGALGFRAIHGRESPADALPLWWLGWANLDLKFYEESEKAFARAVAKEPAYADSHFYIGLARYYRQDFDGAVAAMIDGVRSGKEAVAIAAAESPDVHRPILAYLMDRCATASPPHSLGAAVLAEIQIALAPEDDLLWSYVGLFYRDAGDALRSASSDEERALRQAYYEQAFAGYTRALELAPDHPNHLNDLAVVLHYCLRRDLELARQLYERAAARAEEELARTDLTDELRDLYRIALRDSRDNLSKLGPRPQAPE